MVQFIEFDFHFRAIKRFYVVLMYSNREGLTCDECGKILSRKSSLSYHKKTVHLRKLIFHVQAQLDSVDDSCYLFMHILFTGS